MLNLEKNYLILAVNMVYSCHQDSASYCQVKTECGH